MFAMLVIHFVTITRVLRKNHIKNQMVLLMMTMMAMMMTMMMLMEMEKIPMS